MSVRFDIVYGVNSTDVGYTTDFVVIFFLKTPNMYTWAKRKLLFFISNLSFM